MSRTKSNILLPGVIRKRKRLQHADGDQTLRQDKKSRGIAGPTVTVRRLWPPQQCLGFYYTTKRFGCQERNRISEAYKRQGHNVGNSSHFCSTVFRRPGSQPGDVQKYTLAKCYYIPRFPSCQERNRTFAETGRWRRPYPISKKSSDPGLTCTGTRGIFSMLWAIPEPPIVSGAPTPRRDRETFFMP